MAAGSGGEGGIRTHDTVSRIHAFQACALSHSATSPLKIGRQYNRKVPGYNPPIRRRRPGTVVPGPEPSRTLFVILADQKEVKQEDVMGRGLLLWLLGIPIPIIILIWVLGGLHG